MRVAFGDPAERLITLAEREAAALIVVATPDHSRPRTLLLGSVYPARTGADPCPVDSGQPAAVRSAASAMPRFCRAAAARRR
jgi:hypothetical protein